MAKPVICGLDQLWSYLSTEEKAAEFFKSCSLSKGSGKNAETVDKNAPTRFVLIDADGCLDRLYGGFFNDWVHGGQWCRTYQFLTKVLRCARKSKIELVFVFNGATESDRICDWFATQLELANRSDRIVQIVARRGIPPPKAFWIPPIALDSSLKLVLHALKAHVAVTTSEHVPELISTLRSEPPKTASTTPEAGSAHGLDPSVITAAELLPLAYESFFAESPVYFSLLNSGLPKMFSAHSLKLSVKQTLEAKEVFLDAIVSHLGLSNDRFLLFLTSLGGNILTVDDLSHYFCNKLDAKKNKDGEFEWPALIKSIAEKVKDLPKDPKEAADSLFEGIEENVDSLKEKFVKQHAYYADLAAITNPSEPKPCTQGEEILASEEDSKPGPTPATKRFAALGVSLSQLPSVISSLGASFKPSIFPVDEKLLNITKERHSKGQMHPWVLSLLTKGEIKLPVCIEPHACVPNVNANVIVPVEDVAPLLVQLYRPVRQNAYAVMFDIVCDSKPEGKGEDEKQTTEESTQSKETEGTANTEKDKENENQSDSKEENKEGESEPAAKEEAKEVVSKNVLIREWFVERANGNPTPAVDIVPSVPLSGFNNPSLSKLWLSSESGDWALRLKTFLQCFKADSPTLSNVSHVQPHHVVPCAVMRFLLSQSVGILLPHEFDALIAQAVSPTLQNPEFLADMELVSISARGIHLGSIFMRGVEHALFVNDVCGQPIQSEYCAPWLYFDGKLFQTKLSMASQGASPRDLCEGNPDQLYLFSTLRQAILENLQPRFARYRISPQSGYVHMTPMAVPSSSEIAVMSNKPGHHNRHGDHNAQIASTKGGHLEVGGVVVGHWAGYRGATMHPNQAGFANFGMSPYYAAAPGYYPQQQWGAAAYGAYPSFSANNRRGGGQSAGYKGNRRSTGGSVNAGMGRGRQFSGPPNRNKKRGGASGNGAAAPEKRSGSDCDDGDKQ